jgi:hypothetical protein
MKRDRLWEALATTSDELSAAFEAYKFSHETHRHVCDAQSAAVAGLQNARFERAVQEYCSALEPLVGVRVAFELHAKYRAVMEAFNAQSRLSATLTSTESPMDSDAMERDDYAITQALKELDTAQEALVHALDAAARRDHDMM